MSSKTPVYRLRVTSDFSASHQLRNYNGQCENLHGHNFTVEADIEGSALDQATGILLDFKELKSKLKTILRDLDHKHLNDLPPFQEVNPSSENLARYIYYTLEELLQGYPVILRQICVAEKEGSRAFYSEC